MYAIINKSVILKKITGGGNFHILHRSNMP